MVMRDNRIHHQSGGTPDDYDPHIGRHVLQIGMVLAIAALSAVWITTAYLTQ